MLALISWLLGNRPEVSHPYPKPMKAGGMGWSEGWRYWQNRQPRFAPPAADPELNDSLDDLWPASTAFDRYITPSKDNERPLDALALFSIASFKRIAPGTRLRLVAHLRARLPKVLIDKFEDQFKRGVVIGSDNPSFHSLGGGMAIRNLLREVLPDDLLPATQYPGHPLWRNWDDCYIGALYQLVENAGRDDQTPKYAPNIYLCRYCLRGHGELHDESCKRPRS